MHHLKSLAVSYKLLIINNSILSQQKSDEVGSSSASTKIGIRQRDANTQKEHKRLRNLN